MKPTRRGPRLADTLSQCDGGSTVFDSLTDLERVLDHHLFNASRSRRAENFGWIACPRAHAMQHGFDVLETPPSTMARMKELAQRDRFIPGGDLVFALAPLQ